VAVADAAIRSAAAIMAYKHWTIDDLPWDQLAVDRVDPVTLKVAKAAALVEYNGHDYADYLCAVFHDDAEFQAVARAWAGEEVQHGEALGRWAERVDPTWNFQEAVARFRAGYQIKTDVTGSKRGSQAAELVSRCMVETGTSSYYTALADSSSEPVFTAICRLIAADELRHYKLFYDFLKKYQEKEKLNRFQRLMIILSRIDETEDDELAYAYYAANYWDRPYSREQNYREYTKLAYGYYRPQHLDRMVAMVFKASGLKPHGWLHDRAASFAYRRMRRKAEAPLAA
jgi:rubrerythrin